MTRRAAERIDDGRPPGLLRQYVHFLKHEKKWYLLPLAALLVFLVVLFFFLDDSTAPFVYTLF